MAQAFIEVKICSLTPFQSLTEALDALLKLWSNTRRVADFSQRN